MGLPDRQALWLVDAYNVLRVSLSAGSDDNDADDSRERWWTAERRQLLLDLTLRLGEPAREVQLVFDARHLSEPDETEAPSRDGEPRIRVVFAPSADEWIVAAVRDRAEDFPRRVVVTADRRLGDRARGRGAEVVSTRRFVELCGGSDGVR